MCYIKTGRVLGTEQVSLCVWASHVVHQPSMPTPPGILLYLKGIQSQFYQVQKVSNFNFQPWNILFKQNILNF